MEKSKRALVSSYRSSIQIIPLLALVWSRLEFWVGAANPQSWGRRHGVGSGTVRKSVDEFLQALLSNFSSIFTRFRGIALLSSSTPLFLTPPPVSPKFPHVLLGIGWKALGYEEGRCWAN